MIAFHRPSRPGRSEGRCRIPIVRGRVRFDGGASVWPCSPAGLDRRRAGCFVVRVRRSGAESCSTALTTSLDRNRLGQDNTVLKVRIRSEVRAGGHVDNRQGWLIRPGLQPQRAAWRRSDAEMDVRDENIGAAGGGQEVIPGARATAARNDALVSAIKRRTADPASVSGYVSGARQAHVGETPACLPGKSRRPSLIRRIG